MDHRAKLKRARYHLQTLDDAVLDFSKSDPYEVQVKFNNKQRLYYAVLKRVTPLPPDWCLIIGDAVHNLRSALDTLLYALCCKTLGRCPTEDEVREIVFPVVNDIKDWNAECGRRLCFVEKDVRAEILFHQPFFSTDPALTDTPRHSALGLIRDLSNVDKHRHLVLAGAAATSTSVELVGSGIQSGDTVKGYVGPLEAGTILASWNFTSNGVKVRLPHESEVEARMKLGLDVQFAEGGPGYGASATATLPKVCDFLDKMLFPPLEALL